MVAFNRLPEIDYASDPWDEDDQQWSDEFDSSQHMRDLFFWSGLSLAIGIFIGMAVCSL